jgi:hypothetical protein
VADDASGHVDRTARERAEPFTLPMRLAIYSPWAHGSDASFPRAVKSRRLVHTVEATLHGLATYAAIKPCVEPSDLVRRPFAGK